MRYGTIYILLSISSGDQYITKISGFTGTGPQLDKEAGKLHNLSNLSRPVTPMISWALQGKGSDIYKCIHVATTISGALEVKALIEVIAYIKSKIFVLY